MDEEIMEESLRKETAPGRKVVQISAMVHPDKDWAFIADDGSLWLYHGSWSRIETELKPPCCSRAALCCATAIFWKLETAHLSESWRPLRMCSMLPPIRHTL
jgi:hypothetical protein